MKNKYIPNKENQNSDFRISPMHFNCRCIRIAKRTSPSINYSLIIKRFTEPYKN